MTTEAGTVSSNYEEILGDIFSVYEERILGSRYGDLDSKVYILIDEIQKVDNWGDIIKLYSDRYEQLNFLLSGSVSTLVTEETNETLVGRAHEQVMVPMKFIDYLRYKGVLNECEVSEQSRALRSDLKSAVQNVDANKAVLSLSEHFMRLDSKRPEIRDVLNEYLPRGGYPGYFEMSDDEALRELDQDLYRVVQGDLASVFSVDKRDDLMKILRYFADCTGNKISIRGISNDYGLNRRTVEQYIEYLEEFFLVYRCPHYTPGARSSKKQPMAYVSDAGHLNALLGTSPRIFPETESIGRVLESAVCDRLRRLQFNLSEFQDTTVEYSEQTGEIDFVLSGSDYLIPIEVKRSEPGAADLSALRRFLEQEDDAIGLVVNGGNKFSQNGRLIYLPDWLFFYLC